MSFSRLLILSLVALSYAGPASAQQAPAQPVAKSTPYQHVDPNIAYSYPLPNDKLQYPIRGVRGKQARINRAWNAWLSNPYRPQILRGQDEARRLGLQQGEYKFRRDEDADAKPPVAPTTLAKKTVDTKATKTVKKSSEPMDEAEVETPAASASKAATTPAPADEEFQGGIGRVGGVGGVGR